jgi:hypothetical protein
MSTYGEMQSNIQRFIRRDDLGTEIQDAIKRAIAYYSKENWPWTEVRSTSLTTTSGVKTVSLPSDFSTDVSLLMETPANTIYPVLKKTIQEIEELYISDSLTQEPTIYAIWDDNIYLYPIPDDTYSLIFDYYGDLTELSNSSDTNSWTTKAEQLIEDRAIWWLATHVMRNPQLASEMRMSTLESYRQLRREATMRSSSGRIRKSC